MTYRNIMETYLVKRLRLLSYNFLNLKNSASYTTKSTFKNNNMCQHWIFKHSWNQHHRHQITRAQLIRATSFCLLVFDVHIKNFILKRIICFIRGKKFVPIGHTCIVIKKFIKILLCVSSQSWQCNPLMRTVKWALK